MNMEMIDVRRSPEDILTKKLFLSLFPAQTLSAGLPAINSMLTTFIIGRFLGSNGLAAIGFVGPLVMLVSMLCELFTTGSQLVCGRRLGSGNRAGVLSVFNNTLVLCVIFTLPLVLFLLLLPERTAILLGVKSECLEITVQYIRGYCLGILFQVLSSALIPFLYVDSSRTVAVSGIAVMVAVNFGFNLLNVFWLDWGMFGAGLALAVSNLSMFLCILPHFLFKSKTFRLNLSSLSVKTSGEILYRGLPSAIAPIMLGFRTRVLNELLYRFGGTAAISALTIADTFFSALGATVSNGNQGAVRLISSVLVGEKDMDRVQRIPRMVAESTGWLNLTVYALLFVFAKPLVLLFGADPTNIELFVMASRLYNFWIVTNIIKVPMCATSEALGNVRMVAFTSIMNSFGTPILACLLLANRIGLPVVFSSSWIAELGTILITAIYYTVKSHRLPTSIFRVNYIPPIDPASFRQLLSSEIRSEQDAIKASEQARIFCLEQGLSGKTAFYCSLCIEEICVNIVQHGFPKGKRKDYSANVRVLFENGQLTILVKDDCPVFDPNRWLAMCDSDDPLRGIGIRTVSGLAKSMEYSTNLGLNVLSIVV